MKMIQQRQGDHDRLHETPVSERVRDERTDRTDRLDRAAMQRLADQLGTGFTGYEIGRRRGDAPQN